VPLAPSPPRSYVDRYVISIHIHESPIAFLSSSSSKGDFNVLCRYCNSQ
jgi:hypothetical protein